MARSVWRILEKVTELSAPRRWPKAKYEKERVNINGIWEVYISRIRDTWEVAFSRKVKIMMGTWEVAFSSSENNNGYLGGGLLEKWK